MGLHAAACHSRPPRSISARTKEPTALQRAALRRYRCARCGQMALVCRGCERNQLYCNRGCAKLSRRESQRRAGARHQRTALGRRNHADRQASYRRRQKQKVTHHTPHPAVPPTTCCLSGPTPLAGFPDKEDSNVYSTAVPVRSLASVPTLGAHPADSAVPTPEPAPSPLACAAQTQEYLCHFCQRHSSRYLRRDFLFELSRRPRGRRQGSSP